jgi:hypothetical protein
VIEEFSGGKTREWKNYFFFLGNVMLCVVGCLINVSASTGRRPDDGL